VLGGGDVEGIIEKAPEHKLSIEQAVKIAVETCLGLEFAHGKGIIHRDIKPGNVWLTEDGRAMVGDFGLAVAVDRSRLTQAGMMVGTVNYMPPEQAMGGEITPRSDLYALGAMLYEMVCGRPPFIGDESVAIIGQHLNTPPVAPSWHRPDCPPALEGLILRLLEKDPAKRPGSAKEVRDALQSIALSPAARPQTVVQDLPTAGENPLYRRTFVGRENEVRQLQQAFDAAMSGNGGLVMVVGEPGIGKTALCEQLATYVALRGGKALVGHCYEEGSLSLPYLAFVEAMRSYVLARDPDSLRTELGTGAGEVARIVSEVRDRVQGVELRPSGDPEDDRWRLLQSVTTFLRNAASVQPLAIVLEDLHWADRGTLDLLLHIARNPTGTRLLIIGTYRDVEVDRQHPLSGTLADLRRTSNFFRVSLRGLTVDEVHRMYEAIRGNEVPWGQAEAVHRQTEGNPLFVQEVLRYLVEEGLVVREDGRYVARVPGEGVPEGLRDVVGRRLSHLSEQTNRVLSTASVIGRDFRLDVLQRLATLPEDEVLRAMEEAAERAIIEQRVLPGALAWRFTHAFFRQVLYEEIFAPRRIRIHQQVGRILEALFARRVEEHASELAEHFSQSVDEEDLTKAVFYGEVAGRRAMAVFDHGEALARFQQALKAQEVLDPDDAGRNCDLLLLGAEAMLSLDRRGEALHEVLPRAFEFAESLDDSTRAFHCSRLALDCLIGPITDLNALWLARAARYVGTDVKGQIRLMRAQAGYLIQSGYFGEGTEALKQALALARNLEDANEETGVSWLLINTGELDEKAQLQLIDETDRLPTQGVSTLNRVAFLFASAVAVLSHGDRERAEEFSVRLAEAAATSRHVRGLGLSTVLKALLQSFEGTLESNPLADGWGNEAILYLRSSRWLGLAFSYPPPALPSIGVRSFIPQVIEIVSFALNGDRERALQVYEDLRRRPFEEAHRLGISNYATLLDVFILLEDREAIDEVMTALGRRQSTRRFFHLNPSLTCLPLLMALAERLLSRPANARPLFNSAIEFCAEVGNRPELALSHLGLAELLLDHYPSERDAAIEHLDFAIAEFQVMKMQPALERALRHRGLLKA
jgi:hypothetical protein